jgi:hypothetical protein
MDQQVLQSTMAYNGGTWIVLARASPGGLFRWGKRYCELGETGREASWCSPEKKLTEVAAKKAGRWWSTDSTSRVCQGDGSGRGKLKLWGKGVWAKTRCRFIGAQTSGGGRAAINRQLGGVSSLCFEGGEDLTGWLNCRGEEGMRSRWRFGCLKWWGRQGSDHGRPEAVPWLLEQNMLEVEEEVLCRVGQKEFWAGCRNKFWIDSRILSSKKSSDLNTFKSNLN